MSLGMREKRHALLSLLALLLLALLLLLAPLALQSLLALLLLALLLLAPPALLSLLALLVLNMMTSFLSMQLPTARPTAACRDDGHAITCSTVLRLRIAGA